jgi:hypothetical protein
MYVRGLTFLAACLLLTQVAPLSLIVLKPLQGLPALIGIQFELPLLMLMPGKCSVISPSFSISGWACKVSSLHSHLLDYPSSITDGSVMIQKKT